MDQTEFINDRFKNINYWWTNL